jgi:hypothetical protein
MCVRKFAHFRDINETKYIPILSGVEAMEITPVESAISLDSRVSMYLSRMSWTSTYRKTALILALEFVLDGTVRGKPHRLPSPHYDGVNISISSLIVPGFYQHCLYRPVLHLEGRNLVQVSRHGKFKAVGFFFRDLRRFALVRWCRNAEKIQQCGN